MRDARRANLLARTVVGLASAFLLASCVETSPVTQQARRRRRPDGPAIRRRRRGQRRLRRIPEFGLSLSRLIPSDYRQPRQAASVPRRRRQRPARPFLAARRRLLGGRHLQRPPRAARRVAGLRHPQPRRSRGLLPRQRGDARQGRRRSPAGAAPVRPIGPQRRAGRAATGGRRARFQRRPFLEARRARRIPR